MHLFNKIMLFGIAKSNNVHEKSKNGLENPKIGPRYIVQKQKMQTGNKMYQAAIETSNFFLLLR